MQTKLESLVDLLCYLRHQIMRAYANRDNDRLAEIQNTMDVIETTAPTIYGQHEQRVVGFVRGMRDVVHKAMHNTDLAISLPSLPSEDDIRSTFKLW